MPWDGLVSSAKGKQKPTFPGPAEKKEQQGGHTVTTAVPGKLMGHFLPSPFQISCNAFSYLDNKNTFT